MSRNREGLWKVKRNHLAEPLQEIVARAAALHADQFAAVREELGNRSDSGQEDQVLKPKVAEQQS